MSFSTDKIVDNVIWKDINVGDFLIIEKDQDFPADIIILSSSNVDGSAFITTSSLDGEKNLKPKVFFYYLDCCYLNRRTILA